MSAPTVPGLTCASCEGALYPEYATRAQFGWVHAGGCPRRCPICGTEFVAHRRGRSTVATCCSKSCAAKLRHYLAGHKSGTSLRRCRCSGCGAVCRTKSGLCQACQDDLRLDGGRWEKRPGGLRVWVRDDERQAS